MIKKAEQKVGAVLVVGGGVGGMQASLDLAESGFKVYLVEKSPSIGGVMAQLDKTFPTNDCAMCTLAPRMVDCGGHLNIEKLTYSEVEAIEGEAGNFNVLVRKKARFVDEDKCTGCGECVSVCPIETPGEFDLGLQHRHAIYRSFAQAIPNAFVIDKKGRAPCRAGCPAGVHAQGYIQLIRDKKFKEAAELLRQDMPLPSVCGRVCYHPCEYDCERGNVDEPIAICDLKRFVSDWAMKNDGDVEPLPITHEEKVAVIGSGPAGLACANELLRRGYPVTVFESAEKTGGMLRYAIPGYRLPDDVLDWEVDHLRKLGIEIKTRTRIESLDHLRDQDYRAVFVAAGASGAMRMKVPGEGLEGVMDMLTFLRQANTGTLTSIEGTVAVIGGGNSAMDAARVAVRLGAGRVLVVYRRSRTEMPAHDWEIEEAEQEGAEFEFLAAPVRIDGGDGKASKLVCQRMELGEPDESGRRRPVPIEGSEFDIPVTMVIPAIGQTIQIGGLEDQIARTAWGSIEADPVTLSTSVQGVFAGGDVLTGPASVVEAFGTGKMAAESIDRYIQGVDLREGREAEIPTAPSPDTSGVEKEQRIRQKRLAAAESRWNFDEIVSAMTEEEAVKEAERCLSCGGCSECLECLKKCEADAIFHDQIDRIMEFDVGAIVLAPGYEIFNPDLKKELGYARYPNVVSSLQFERILSASGPYLGQICRPSDGEHPKRVAFIQCVGSRDEENDYCSSVCCMYATKQAIISKEHEPDLECTIFFIDLRAHGKEFEAYYNRAESLGVRYIRCRPSSIKEVPGTHNLRINYQTGENELANEEFDLVVLSIGLRPPGEVDKIAERFGIQLDGHGFAETQSFSPIETSREGVFVCGPFSEPKDIPETVMEASASAAGAMALLSDVRGTLVAHKEYPPEKDVSGQESRIGVFVCHCGKNIGGVADVPSVAEYAKTLPDVVYTEDNLYTCSTDTQELIKEKIAEHDLNRIIVASCSPRTHEPLFRNTCREAGLNEYLFEMANIRDQNTWVHMNEPEKATQKAKDLVRIAVAKSRLLEPLQKGNLKVNNQALVIGGGIAGMTASLFLADQGFHVHLVEREKQLGGNFIHIRSLLNGDDPRKRLTESIERINSHPMIDLYLESTVAEAKGSVGNFETTIVHNGNQKQVSHGAVIVATGAAEYKPTEYLYGNNPRVITQLTLEEWIADNNPELQNIKSVVMIQCVGSREEERPYCSRICCSQAVKNAVIMKDILPDTGTYVLYRDIRTYGFLERHYREAREKGVRFIRYEADQKPQVSTNRDGFQVSCVDHILNSPLNIQCDLIVLAPAIVSRDDADEVGKLYKVPLNQDRFFLEAHMKLRPVDFATDGVFMCGLAHAPKSIEESIAQASAAASRAATLLSKEELELDATISEVVDENCDGCAYCIDPCPFAALTLIEYMYKGEVKKTVERNEALCKGCGVCMATCPKQGIFVRNFKLEQLGEMVNAALGVS